MDSRALDACSALQDIPRPSRTRADAKAVEFSPHNLLADQKSWGLTFRKNTPYSLYKSLYRVIASDE